MPTFDELKRRYMLVGGESGGGGGGSFSSGGGGGGGAHPVFTDSDVTPLIGGRSYYHTLRAKLNELGTGDTSQQFIYIAGWWLDPNFSLDGISGATLVDLLKQKSQAGVDVRVLGWVMAPEVLQSSMVQSAPEAASILHLNSETMQFVNALRAESTLANKACLNILAHPAGSVHRKMVVLSNGSQAIGFTGGLDFQRGRHDPTWHDVQAQVTGPAVQAIFDAFREMWNEVRGRSGVSLSARGVTCTSHNSSMPNLPSRTLVSTTSSKMHVQSGRTVPTFNFSTVASVGLPTNSPVSYAPSGVFEIKRLWQHGIGAAERYIYVEDQGFSSAEVFDWINSQVKANSDLKVILLIGRVDPNDQPNATAEKAFRVAVNNHLVRGLSSAQIDRIGLFSDQNKVIHSKTTIVDDQWALVGSANCMRRSLYTDFEHSVAYMDEAGRAVPQYREDLWGTHLQQSFIDLDSAIAAWFALPFQGSGTTSPRGIVRVRLPMPATSFTSDEQVIYDEILDADSRQAWGGSLASMFISRFGAQVLSL